MQSGFRRDPWIFFEGHVSYSNARRRDCMPAGQFTWINTARVRPLWT